MKKQMINEAILKVVLAVFAGPQDDDKERGDVPGWVMITMMSALLVAAILVVAQEALVNMFNNAMGLINR
ncbi:hypothetical protein [Rothia nasimurium]|uniref:hypothetical protein n=1 Tax=Rothia nasimurium TaxID=85336 RepID=UPI001F33D44B|nr:hypothetical protein [Rothia nasimurium]